MSAPAHRGVRWATILNTRENIAQQINEAQETKKPLVFDIESEAKNHSVLTIPRWIVTPQGDEDLLLGINTSEEEVSVHIPYNTEEPATAVLPL